MALGIPVFVWAKRRYFSIPTVKFRVERASSRYVGASRSRSFRLVLENHGDRDLYGISWWLWSDTGACAKVPVDILKSGESVLVLAGEWETNMFPSMNSAAAFFKVYEGDFYTEGFCEDWGKFPQRFSAHVHVRGRPRVPVQEFDVESFR